MDPYVLLSLITAASSLIVSVMTHIKHSKCWNCEIETRDNTHVSDERRPLVKSQPEPQDDVVLTPSRTRASRVTFDEKKIQA